MWLCVWNRDNFSFILRGIFYDWILFEIVFLKIFDMIVNGIIKILKIVLNYVDVCMCVWFEINFIYFSFGWKFESGGV